MIVYASSHFRKHEEIYPRDDLELDVVVFALKNYKHCLYGEPCDIFIGHEFVYI